MEENTLKNISAAPSFLSAYFPRPLFHVSYTLCSKFGAG